MRNGSQTASRFEQTSFRVGRITGVIDGLLPILALLPLKKRGIIDKRFVEYCWNLSDGVTGAISKLLRRAAFQGLAENAECGVQQLHMWCRMQLSRAKVVISL